MDGIHTIGTFQSCYNIAKMKNYRNVSQVLNKAEFQHYIIYVLKNVLYCAYLFRTDLFRTDLKY